MIVAAGLIGGFYMFAGIMLFRTMATDRLLDQAIKAISFEPADPAESRERAKMLIVGTVTFAGGLALATMSRWAPPLFLAGLTIQIVLLWQLRTEVPAEGRQRTINAAIVYAVVTLFVLYAGWAGVLKPWLDSTAPASLVIEIIVIAAVTSAIALFFRLRGRLDRGQQIGRDVSANTEDPDPELVTVLRLAPEYGCWPLWDDETGTNLNHEAFSFPKAFMSRLDDWDSRFQETYDPNDPSASGFKLIGSAQAWHDEGLALAEELKAHWHGDVKTQLPSVHGMTK